MAFKDIRLINPLQRALNKEGYNTPTPIQAQAIPHLLEGKDMIGIAQTGTGKTAAFILPLLQRMSEDHKFPSLGCPRLLVLAPTRELAAQIGQSFETYGRFLKYKHAVIFGGVSQRSQVKALSRRVDILVATPGRLLDLIDQDYIDLGDVEFFVLDEADRMLDMGFIHDVRKVVSQLPVERQSLFFSATMSPQVGELAKSLLTDPKHVEVTPQATTVERIEQRVFYVDKGNKDKLLLRLLKQRNMRSVLIFTRTKRRANKVALMLNKNNVLADAIHGNKTQNQRTKAMNEFRSGRLKVLVATDIAARGIDIDEISHVINYDLPNESESYVHRIGRTARAGADGTAYSFCAADERNYLREIEKLTCTQIEVMTHQYHSEQAKNAVGAAAKPAPKKPRGTSDNSQKKTQKPGNKRSGDERSGNKKSAGQKSGNKKPDNQRLVGKKKDNKKSVHRRTVNHKSRSATNRQTRS